METELNDLFEAFDAIETLETLSNSSLFTRPHIYRERQDYFNKYDDKDFFIRYRLSKESVLFLLDKIEHLLEYPNNRNKSVSPIGQLLCALRFYATGNHLIAVADMGGISVATCSRIVKRVSKAIVTLRHEFIKFPNTHEEQVYVKEKFYRIARFPNVIGCIDCTHVKIQSPAQYVTTAVVTAGVLGVAYCTYRICQEGRKKKLPQKWRQVGTLKSLHAYPVKSCGVVPLDKAECTLLGLKRGWLRDRVLCVVDDSYNFITARVYPELLLIEPKVESSVLTLKHPAMATSLKVDLAEVVATAAPPKTATVWGNEVPAHNCGLEASQWFTKLLNRESKNFHLVLYASQVCRPNKDPRQKYFNFSKDSTGAFPDDTSYHLVNEASVDDLNSRLKGAPVTARQFRPNFILSGCQPYDEDNWSFIKIGENVFEVVMPCLRCVLTTVDPETGSRSSQNEPLQTLKGYRQHDQEVIRKAFGNSPRMGLQLALRSGTGGAVAVDEPVYVA